MPPEEVQSPAIGPTDKAQESNPVLSDRILDFLSSPWLYASGEHLEQATQGNPLEFYQQNSSAWHHFVRHAYKIWNLTPCWHAFPKEDNSRILLLSASQTEELMQLLGLLALIPELRSIIDGSEIRRLKKDFPGLYPDCLRLTGLHRSLREKMTAGLQDSASDLSRKSVTELGRILLTGMLNHLPEELLRRWNLKFSGDCSPSSPTSSLTLRESNELLLSLLHHQNPESWQLCCC